MRSDPNITAHHLNFLTLAGADYTATTVVLTFMSGDGPGTTLDASIPIVDDSLVEGPIQETISVELLVGGSSETGTVRITDNDGKFTHCEPHRLQLMCTSKQVSLSVLYVINILPNVLVGHRIICMRLPCTLQARSSTRSE